MSGNEKKDIKSSGAFSGATAEPQHEPEIASKVATAKLYDNPNLSNDCDSAGFNPLDFEG